MAFRDRRRARKARTLRVRRVVRRVELRSVLKLGLLFHACCYGVTLGVGALLWRLAVRYDLVHNFEKFMSQIGFADDFRIDGPTLWRVAVRGGAVLVVLNTVLTWLVVFFYNAVSGLIGGVVLSMLEETPVIRRPARPDGAIGQPGGSTRSTSRVLGDGSVSGPGRHDVTLTRKQRSAARNEAKKGTPPPRTDQAEVASEAEDPTTAMENGLESPPVLVDWASAFGPTRQPESQPSAASDR